MPKEYVTNDQNVYRVGATGVSLDSLVYLYREGMSPESMVESYLRWPPELGQIVKTQFAVR